MVKDVLGALDMTAWAEMGLVLFALVFVAVATRTLLGDRRVAERNANIVLEPDDE